MHPYGISVLVPQMSFCGETRVIVTKCKLLYQPSSLHNWFHHKLVKKKKESSGSDSINNNDTVTATWTQLLIQLVFFHTFSHERKFSSL